MMEVSECLGPVCLSAPRDIPKLQQISKAVPFNKYIPIDYEKSFSQ